MKNKEYRIAQVFLIIKVEENPNSDVKDYVLLKCTGGRGEEN